MAWKKALFLGGAVLLLAACSDATAPRPLARDGTTPVSGAAAKSIVPTSGSLDAGGSLLDPNLCRSGYYVRSGEKDVCVEVPEIQ